MRGVLSYSSLREEVAPLRIALKKDEEMSCEHLKLFRRDWWAGSMDRFSKEMFVILKKMHAKDEIPLLRSPQGPKASSNEEKLAIVHDHFSQILSPLIDCSKERINTMAKIASVLKQLVSMELALLYGCRFLYLPARVDNIHAQTKKELDDLPSEFFMEFKDCLLNPIKPG